MELIVSALICVEFVTIAVVATGWYMMQRLYDAMLALARTPPKVNLDGIHNQLRIHEERQADLEKAVETLKSAIVLKSAFK